MNRLFFRISIGVFLSVLLSVFIFGVFTAIGIGDSLTQMLPPDTKSTAVFIQNTSYRMDEPDFIKLVEKTRTVSEVPIALKNRYDKSIPQKFRKSLSRGNIHWELIEEGQGEGLVIYIPVLDYSKIYVLGPDSYFPMPNMYNLLVAALFISLVIIGIGYIVTKPLQSDLKKLEYAAKGVEQGDLSVRSNVQSKNAIGDVGRNFDDMVNRVEELLVDRLRMIQAIAHELRTPVARVRFGVEMLTDEDTFQKREERSVSIAADLEELEGLITEFLTYVRYDKSGDPKIETRDVSVNHQINEQVDRLQPLQLDKSVTVDFETEYFVQAEEKSFGRVIHNLLSNALRYANTTVHISAKRKGSYVILTIEDDGPGIPKKMAHKVFEPFVRLDKSRSRDSGGVGLGLAIVANIVNVFNGEIAIDKSKLGGTKITLKWVTPRR